jgi:Domain of unknown function (DUF4148)
MFKALIPAVVIASALAAPTFAFAQQSNGPVTRAEVKAQLVQLEKAGYNPGGDEIDYPNDIQAAEARVAVQNGAVATSYGSSSNGTSVAGSRSDAASTTPAQAVFFGH